MSKTSKKKRSKIPGTVAKRERRSSPLIWLGAIASGCFTFLAFPDTNLYPLIWICLVPLLLSLNTVRSKRRAFVLGWLTGFITNFGGFYWIASMLLDFGHFPTGLAWLGSVLFAAYQGLVFAVFAYLIVRLKTERTSFSYLTVPAIMVFSEAVIPFVFPWYLGNGLALQITFAQITELLGTATTSAVVVAVNCAVANAIDQGWRERRVPLRPLIVTALLFLALFVFGSWRLAAVDRAIEQSDSIRIGMVEADIGIYEKEGKHLSELRREETLYANTVKHQLLSRSAVNDGAELIVWPETSYMPTRGVGIKRTKIFGLARTQENRLLLMLEKGQFVAPEDLPEARALLQSQGHIRAVVGGREDTALVLARGGRIYRLDPTGFREELSGVAVNLNAGWTGGGWSSIDQNIHAKRIYCKEAGETCDLPAVAVGEGGVFLRRAQGRWQKTNTASRKDLLAVDGRSAQDVFAVGAKGVIVHDSGSTVRVVADTGETLRAVAVHPTGRVVAVGDRCTVRVQTVGGKFETVRRFTTDSIPCTERLRAVTFLADGRWIAGGRGGVILYEQTINGSAIARTIKGGGYIRGLSRDAFGYTTATLGDGRIIDVSQPESENLTTRYDTKEKLYRMAHLGYLWDVAIPDDATYVYASPRPLPSSADKMALDQFDTHVRSLVQKDQGTRLMDRDAVQRGFEAHLLFGGISYRAHQVLERSGSLLSNLQNTAFLLGPTGRVDGMYHKIRLLIFGEYIPFANVFPWLQDLVPEGGQYIAGERLTPLVVQREKGPVRIAPLICYEDILTHFSERALALSPDLLVNVTNDAWFGKTSEPALHLQLATARCIETRKFMVRSTNTGISAYIDPAGRILDATQITGAEYVVRDIPLMRMETLHGLPAAILFWSLIAWVVLLILSDVIVRAPRKIGRTTELDAVTVIQKQKDSVRETKPEPDRGTKD